MQIPYLNQILLFVVVSILTTILTLAGIQVVKILKELRASFIELKTRLETYNSGPLEQRIHSSRPLDNSWSNYSLPFPGGMPKLRSAEKLEAMRINDIKRADKQEDALKAKDELSSLLVTVDKYLAISTEISGGLGVPASSAVKPCSASEVPEGNMKRWVLAVIRSFPFAHMRIETTGRARPLEQKRSRILLAKNAAPLDRR